MYIKPYGSISIVNCQGLSFDLHDLKIYTVDGGQRLFGHNLLYASERSDLPFLEGADIIGVKRSIVDF